MSQLKRLEGKKVAILATDGFEQSELFEPKMALEESGAEVKVISPEAGKIKAWDHTHWGEMVTVDVDVEKANADEFDALMLPGGVINPDRLRTNSAAIKFIEAFIKDKKPIAAICHGPQMLIETDFLKGKTITSWPSLKTDLKNAGANWVDQQVVRDQNLITSRKPDDIPVFNLKMIELFAEAS